MADGDARSVRLERRVRVAPPRAYRAWTDPAEVRHWWCPMGFVPETVEIDPRPGGRLRLAMRSPDGNLFGISGVYRVVEPPHRLVHSWVWDHIPGMETEVTVEFVRDGDGTRVVVAHDGFPDAPVAARHVEGWTSVLDRLANHAWED